MPVGWLPTTLGELGKWSSGGTPNRGCPEYYGGEIPWVKTGDLTDGLITSIPETITELGLSKSSAKLFPPGTLLIAMYGATIGKLGLLSNAATTNQACAALLPEGQTREVIPYLFWFLKERRDDLRAVGQGGAQPNISQTVLKEYPCPLPPLNEQRRIVAKIEDLSARSRAAKEALDAIPPLLERFRQSVLAAAFRGDLTKQWREQNPNVEPASVLLDRIRQERRHRWEQDYLAQQKAKGKTPKDDKWKEKYQEPEPVDTTGLPELPEGWCWVSLNTIADLQGGIQKGKKRKPSDTLRTIPYLRVANVQRGYLNLDEVTELEATESEIGKLRLRVGDILFNEGGDRDKLGRGWVWSDELAECIHQNHVFRARLYQNGMPPELISHYGNSRGQAYFLQHGAQTTNLASLSLTKLGELPVPLMPLSEQSTLLDIVTELLSSLGLLERTLQNGNLQIGKLNQSILAKAFRGELVPQDPNDEPASVLLERIRADRANSESMGTGRKRSKG